MGRSRSSTPPRTSHTTVPLSSRNTWRGRRNGSLGGHHYPWYDRHTFVIPPSSCDCIGGRDARDPRRKVFGAGTHQYKVNPPLSVSVIEAFENQQGVSLPEDYRSFIT